MINFDEIMYNSVHAIMGRSSILTPKNGHPVEVVVIDKTSGVELFDGGVTNVLPAASIRAVELSAVGLTRADLSSAALTMNGKLYRVSHTQPKPTPNGESDGEIMMFLTELK